MLSKREIEKFLKDDKFKTYDGTFESREKDNTLLQEQVANLLRLQPDKIQEILQKVRLKALGQILGLSGFAKQGNLQNVSVKMTFSSSNVTKTTTIPDFNDENIVQFASWFPLEYLIYQFYFLLEIYLQLTTKKLQNPFPTKVKLETLQIVLEHEIWVTANAYRSRSAYGEIVNNDHISQREQEEKLDSFATTFLTTIKSSEEGEYEYRLASGSRDHAVYIVFLKTEAAQVELRVDNPSEAEPIVFKGIDIASDDGFNLLKRYIIAICQAIKEGSSIAKDIYENDEQPYLLPKQVKSEIGYQPLTPQSAPNCVVEGFMRGMWYQLWVVEKTSRDEVFQWLYDKNRQFAAAQKPVGDMQLRQRQLRDKMLTLHYRTGATLQTNNGLHEAVIRGDIKEIRRCLNNGEDVNQVNNKGEIPLHIAVYRGHVRAVHVLLDAGANVDMEEEGGKTSIYIAALTGDTNILETLLDIDKGDSVDVGDKDGRTPLYVAAFHNNTEAMRTLLRNGAEVNLSEKTGWTPLLVACQTGHIEAVKILLEAKAKVNLAAKDDGRTALHIATANGYIDIVQLLIDAGAKVTQENNKKLTPLDIAKQNGCPELVEILNPSKIIKQNKGIQEILHHLLNNPANFILYRPTSTILIVECRFQVTANQQQIQQWSDLRQLFKDFLSTAKLAAIELKEENDFDCNRVKCIASKEEEINRLISLLKPVINKVKPSISLAHRFFQSNTQTNASGEENKLDCRIQ